MPPTRHCSMLLALIATGLVLQSDIPSANAETPAEFYKGRSITAVIGFAPGGGYNHYMRALSKFMPRHIPGNPTILSRNMPGGGSLIAANYIYNNAAKDGSVIGMFASSALFSKMLGETKAAFDIDKFTWIGNMDQTIGTCAIWHESGLKSFDDLYRREVVFGASGPSSVNSQHARVFNALLGTKVKVIHGYDGSTGVLLAMQRGELQGGCGFALSSLKATRRDDWQSGRLKVIIQTGREKSPELVGVPHLYDMAKSEDDKKVMDLIYGTHSLGRPVAAPPSLPADRIKVLRAAFDATTKDPEFLKDAETLHLPIDPWTGEQSEKFITQVASYSQAVADRAQKALEIGEVVNVQLKKLNGKISAIDKRALTIKDASGNETKVAIHPKNTKVSIAGKPSSVSQLKADMSCDLEYFGAGDLAPKMACN